ncbi:MAG: hypothetical protein RJA70_927 [Pseudomonadota bacterium]|jgi:hypothetical protein
MPITLKLSQPFSPYDSYGPGSRIMTFLQTHRSVLTIGLPAGWAHSTRMVWGNPESAVPMGDAHAESR